MLFSGFLQKKFIFALVNTYTVFIGSPVDITMISSGSTP